MTEDIGNYQSSKIYKIINSKNNEIYVGSTTNELEKRFIKHKDYAKTKPEASKLHMFMNETGIGYFEIVEIEKYPGELTKQIGTLNEKMAGKTPEDKKEYDKVWKQNNKDRINERRRERRRENPEKTNEDAQRHRKAHREKHEEELQLKASVKHDCPCGGKYTEGHKHEHMNSKRHLKYLGTFNEEEYKNSKRCEELKNRYDKNKDNNDKEKMKEYKRSWYENKKKQYEESLY